LFSAEPENRDSAKEQSLKGIAGAAAQQGQSTRDDVSGFVEICETIRLKCWKRDQPDAGQRNDNLSLFEDAYDLYKRQVSPSLTTILDSYRDNAEVCTRVRNAAAMCLSSLACGIVLANNLDSAYAVASEALALVLNEALKTEIQALLGFIDSEKQQRLDTKPPSDTSRHQTEQILVSAAASASKNETEYPFSFETLAARRTQPWYVAVTVGLLIVFGICILLEATRARVQQSSPPVFRSGTDTEVQTSTASPDFETVDPSAPVPRPQTSHDLPGLPVTNKPNLLSLSNGTEPIERFDVNGLGQLTISNASGQDAAVKLKSTISPGKTLRFAYIRAKNEVTISGISPGDYLLQFATGKDWDSSGKAFHKNQEFSEFEKPLSFSEHRMDDNSMEYSVHKVALRTLPNGNMHKKEITAADFDDGGL
jgi:hypothetical protein